MKKRIRSDSMSTTARIMAAAVKLFVENGYHGTSVAMIAHATELTPGALYRHFVSKEDLLLALVRKFESDYLDELAEEVNSQDGNALDTLKRSLLFAGRFAEENPDLAIFLSVVSAEFQGLKGAIRSELDRTYSKYARILRRMIEEGKRQNQFDQDLDTHSLAYMVIGLVEGAFLKFQHNRNILDPDDYLRTFLKVLLQGLKPMPLQ